MSEIDQLPPHIEDLATKYNVPKSFLQPERYLFQPLFLNKVLHQALTEITSINPDKILNNQELSEDLSLSLKDNDLTFLGVDHGSFRSHELIAQMISKVDTNNVAIAVEYPLRFQDMITSFLSTGKFRESDDPALYTKIYKTVQRTSEYVAVS